MTVSSHRPSFTLTPNLLFLWHQPPSLHYKNICISTDILWRVFHNLAEPVSYTFVTRKSTDLQCGPWLHYFVDLSRNSRGRTPTRTPTPTLGIRLSCTVHVYTCTRAHPQRTSSRGSSRGKSRVSDKSARILVRVRLNREVAGHAHIRGSRRGCPCRCPCQRRGMPALRIQTCTELVPLKYGNLPGNICGYTDIFTVYTATGVQQAQTFFLQYARSHAVGMMTSINHFIRGHRQKMNEQTQ